jgi:hypothetical protein
VGVCENMAGRGECSQAASPNSVASGFDAQIPQLQRIQIRANVVTISAEGRLSGVQGWFPKLHAHLHGWPSPRMAANSSRIPFAGNVLSCPRLCSVPFHQNPRCARRKLRIPRGGVRDSGRFAPRTGFLRPAMPSVAPLDAPDVRNFLSP